VAWQAPSLEEVRKDPVKTTLAATPGIIWDHPADRADGSLMVL